MSLTHWKLANLYKTNFQSHNSIKNAKIIILHQQSHSQREISKQTGYSRCGIQAVIKKCEESGEVKDKKRTGRPRKLSEFLRETGGSPARTWLSIWQLHRDAELTLLQSEEA